MNAEIDLTGMSYYLSSATLFILLAVSSYTDWKYRKIYNKVTVPAFLAGLLLAALPGSSVSFMNALLACLLGFAVFFLMFLAGQMGGGDVKLVAAIGALTGYPFIVDAVFFGVMAGGVYAIAVSLAKGVLGRHLKNIFHFFLGLFLWRQPMPLGAQDSTKIPYGLCISMGTAIAYVVKQRVLMSGESFFLGL